MKKINLFLTAIFFALVVNAQTVGDFENLPLGTDTFWNGSTLSGSFITGPGLFFNSYDTTSYTFDGFAYSNVVDTTTAGYGNQYSAIPGSGYNGSKTYGVADEYGLTNITLPGNANGTAVNGIYITNSTFAYLSMKNGDAFAKKFGGVSGNDPDWFRLTIKGFLHGNQTIDSVDFYLADFRFADNLQDYIIKTWKWVDLSPLGIVDSITFHLASTDTGQFGMNTPAYFCVDNLVAQPGAIFVQDANVTITYNQDTLISVIANYVTDTANATYTVTLLSSPMISGASAVVNSSNQVWYIPAVGVVAPDTLTYKVCDNNNNCDTAQIFFNITGVTGIKDVPATQTKLYPNPFSNSFMVYHAADVKEICVHDLAGRMVINQQCTEQNTTINAGMLSAGAYLVKTISEKETTVTKVIKQ